MPRRPALPCRNPNCPNLRPCSVHGERKPFETDGQPRRGYGTSGWDWQRRRQAVIERDGGLCQLRLEGCRQVATTADHIVSPRHGGSDEPSNLRAACRPCNERRRRQQAREGRR